jgi:hypothetical protein
MKQFFYLPLTAKMNLKRITDLNVNSKRLKIFQGSFLFIPALKLQWEKIGKHW